MCEHLEKLAGYLRTRGIRETYRGQVWTENCREWIYFDCVLDIQALESKLGFDPCVRSFRNDDARSGREAGFYCELCKDAIVGFHPDDAEGKVLIS